MRGVVGRVLRRALPEVLSAAEQPQESFLPPPSMLIVRLQHPAIINRHIRTRRALCLRRPTVPVRIATIDTVWRRSSLAVGPVPCRRCAAVAGCSSVGVNLRYLLLARATAGGRERLYARISTAGHCARVGCRAALCLQVRARWAGKLGLCAPASASLFALTVTLLTCGALVLALSGCSGMRLGEDSG